MNDDDSKMLLQIPFDGFYNSMWNDVIDATVSRVAQDLIESDSRFKDMKSKDVTQALSLTVDWAAAYARIAGAYANNFGTWLQRKLALPGSSFAWTFEYIQRAQNYNYFTDDIFVSVSENVIETLYDQADKEVLRAVVYDAFKARDGFVPFYSHDAEEWLGTPTTYWDADQTGVLLKAWLKTVDEPAKELEWILMDGHVHAVSHDLLIAGVDKAFESLAA